MKKLYRVSGSYQVTKYVDRFILAESKDDAESQAWSEHYESEVDTYEDRGEFEPYEVEEVNTI